MKLLELHMLQSHAVFCGNRDDVGRPKTAIFGGVKRARLSSQCLKRAIRLHMQRDEKWKRYFCGVRTKQVVSELVNRLKKENQDVTEAERTFAQAAAHVLAGLDFEKDGQRVTTSMFLSDGQYDALFAKLKNLERQNQDLTVETMTKLATLKVKEKPSAEDSKQVKKLEGSLDKLLKASVEEALDATKQPTVVADAADIALFGRMVASHPQLTIEAAAMFSHALSTHKADPEYDFFTAVDDRQREEDTGSDMMGNLEFISATYYRYAALNLDLLFYQTDRDGKCVANLAHFAKPESSQDRKNIVQAFIEAALQAVPSGRKTSMASPTSVDFAVGVVREGQPIQLVNAFEAPVRANDGSGFISPSVARLENYRAKMFEAWGIELSDKSTDKPPFGFCFYPDAPDAFTPSPLAFPGFVEALVSHVD